VIGDIPPERSFNPIDIRAYGADDIGGLLEALGPQVASGRGDSGPVVLLNGKRVSSFREISRIPTEAIERTEVFPEELALKYGYRADQKVVNIITFKRFSSRVGQLTYALPTEGGRDTVGLNANYLQISGDNRIAVDGDYSRSGSLKESERTLEQAPGAAGLEPLSNPASRDSADRAQRHRERRLAERRVVDAERPLRGGEERKPVRARRRWAAGTRSRHARRASRDRAWRAGGKMAVVPHRQLRPDEPSRP
jgi:hypothetical protein